MKTEILNNAPALSITIASWSGEAALTRCLDSVMPQAGDAEVIVAYRGVTDLAGILGGRYPTVRFIGGAADASVFVLRTLAALPAKGKIMAMLEDHAAVGPGWVQSLAASRAKGWKVFGGPIDNGAPASAYEWALYFVEYGIYLPPMRAGETNILSGVNIAYDRRLLQSCEAIWAKVFYETDVNAALARAGHRLYMIPEAAVSSRLRMKFGEAMDHLYTGGKHFGQFRKFHSTTLKRALLVLISPLVPLVLLWRIIRLTLARQPGRWLALILGLPALLLLLGAWCAGEAVGYARRPSAQSPAEETS